MRAISILMITGSVCLSACTQPGKSVASGPECQASTSAEWRGDFRRPRDLANGYGAVYDTYIKLETKSEADSNTVIYQSCQMERSWCPEPYETKGCQVFKCEHDDIAGVLLFAKDHQGERYFKLSEPSTVRWTGTTFTCDPK